MISVGPSRIRISLLYCAKGLAGLFLFCYAQGLAAQTIVEDFSYPINEHEVADFSFLNPKKGWMTLYDHKENQSYVFRTADGGKTWSKSRGLPGMLYSIQFVNENLGWTLQEIVQSEQPNVYLLCTRDGGKTWKRMSPAPLVRQTLENKTQVRTFAFIDERHGWFAGSGLFGVAMILETSDGGKTVNERADISTRIGEPIGMHAEQGWGVWIYGNGFVVNSKDMGKTWAEPLHINANKKALSLSSMVTFKDGRGWLAGQAPNATIFSSSDYGLHWKIALESEEAQNFSDIWFSDSTHGCALSESTESTLLLCTEDGVNWKTRSVLPDPRDRQADIFTTLVLLNSGRGWTMRAGGFLFETTDAGQTWREIDLLRK